MEELRYHPGAWARRCPEKPAVVMAGSGDTVSYATLEERSARFARVLADRGISPGEHIALLLENHPSVFEVCWGAQRSGVYYTPVNHHLTASEAAYIVDDSDARLLVTSGSLAEVAAAVAGAAPAVEEVFVVGDPVDGFTPHAERPAAQSPVPQSPAAQSPVAQPLTARSPAAPPGEREGAPMFYSSGTTGHPKGVEHPLPSRPYGADNPYLRWTRELWHHDGDTVYLSPAPLYHSAPLLRSMSTHRLGGTVVVMEHFDAEGALAAIERYGVTHAQFVPTMFVRMLRLPEETRRRYDLSSLRHVVHAAAPCPIEVKEQMIAWLGPIVSEYYSATERVGLTALDAEEWLAHRGSVGRAVDCRIHILDDEGEELPPGCPGVVWFEGGWTFAYHGDPARTAEAHNARGWATVGDVGYLDGDGYLFLTDRRDFTIVSGGVNIYPQEVEAVLTAHPRVLDVAVFGVPDEEFGEAVKAVVQPVDPDEAGEALAGALIGFCRDRLAHYKCPRSVDFTADLPRLPTGKLAKQRIRERYWAGHTTRVV